VSAWSWISQKFARPGPASRARVGSQVETRPWMATSFRPPAASRTFQEVVQGLDGDVF
jgi:hypothetical protein